MPPDPPYNTVHTRHTWPRSRAFERRTASDERAKAGERGWRARTAQLHPTRAALISTLYICIPPPLLQSLDPPLHLALLYILMCYATHWGEAGLFWWTGV